MATKRFRTAALASLFAVTASVSVFACSSDDNAAPTPPTFGNGGQAGAAGSAAGAAGASGSAGGSAGQAGAPQGGSAGAPQGGSAGAPQGGSGGAPGGGSGGCSQSPTTTTEFLNRCTDGTCTPFDNKARIPGFTGTLPPLP